MLPEELKKIRESFPQTVGVKLVLMPWIKEELSRIERSWHNDDAAGKECKATQKILLQRMIRDLELELNPDTPQAVTGNSSDSGNGVGT